LIQWIATPGLEYFMLELNNQSVAIKFAATYCRDDRRPIMTDNYSTDTNSQRQRLLAWLLTGPITTLQARKELDIMHPAARVQELKAAGHKIETHRTTSDSGKAKHRRVAYYVLLAEV
jgi:hypothetical protein